nr:TonB-dependent receptor [Bacteroidaceae bacterium]
AVEMFGRTNNEQIGLSAKVGARLGKFFWRANMTLIDYADYKVPTDSIQYYSYWIKLDNQRLRNTAGLERDGSMMFGYAGYNFHTDLKISDSYSKSGFFANAHGLEVRLSDIDYDHSRRDIDLPYQWVNHLKVASHTSWIMEGRNIDLNLAYQNNLREELSEPVSHGYMPTPENSKERRFNKSTYTAGLTLRQEIENHTLQGGLSGEYQNNRRDGWGFIIPDFETALLGVYLMDRWDMRENLILNAGMRFDYAHTHIYDYQDWYKTPINGDSVYVERSQNLSRNFTSVTWSAGVNYSLGAWIMKANIGKSFRVPIPKELGANGVNYHIFRYEKGNAHLDPEESYQLDATISWANKSVEITVEPYLNYFPNYIYLNPTSQYVEGLQLYSYTQAEVLRYGLEAQLTWKMSRRWEMNVQGEYLYARQQSGDKKGYTLPFSTPWSTDAGIKYAFGKQGDGFAKLAVHIVGRQDEIVPPEKPTDGYWTLNFSAGKSLNIHNKKINVAFHADNLLDKRYYDHTSYYRLIDVPEPGRNFSCKVSYQF